MALIVDEQSNFKHFCKICKKGFLCGRALGGHMRAHGIGGDESEAAIDDDDDDDDPASDWEDKSNSSSRGSIIPQSSNKRMYALRTNPNNRVRSSRVCENCGKEFISWKSFLEHGNGKCCNSDDTEESGLLSGGSDNDGHGRRGCGWSKRKRSFRMTTTTTTTTTTTKLISEEEDLANCLMMLSNASESYASEAEHRPIPPQPQPRPQPILHALDHHYKAKAVSSGISSVNPKGLFECKACKKVFNSHQALGGHRASHKKVKGCFAARLDIGDPDQDNNNVADNNIPPENLLLGGDQEFMKPSKSTLQLDQQGEVGGSKKKSKVHQCSICHRVFSSGQALGGHKRCHWITSNNAPDPLTLARFQQLQDQIEQVQDQFAHNSSNPTILDLNNIPLTKANNNNVTANIRTDPRNRLSFEVSTDIFLQSNWGTTGNIIENDNYETQENKTIYQSNYNATNNIEDEAESKVKLAKLCEIKDHMSISGNSSPWLQVGIGSSTTLGVDP